MLSNKKNDIKINLLHFFGVNFMKNRFYLVPALCFSLILTSCLSSLQEIADDLLLVPDTKTAAYTNEEAIAAMKDALGEGIKFAASELSKENAYYKNSVLKILLPPEAELLPLFLEALLPPPFFGADLPGAALFFPLLDAAMCDIPFLCSWGKSHFIIRGKPWQDRDYVDQLPAPKRRMSYSPSSQSITFLDRMPS